MTTDREFTLTEILTAREARAVRQRRIIQERTASLISFMVNMPGPCKNSRLSRQIFEAGVAAILAELSRNHLIPRYREFNYRPTGAEAFLALQSDGLQLKRLAVAIEEGHPLGRLFDIDVITNELNAVSRVQIGKPRRKCLICAADAAACGRSRRHSLAELLDTIRAMAEEYFQIAGKDGCRGFAGQYEAKQLKMAQESFF